MLTTEHKCVERIRENTGTLGDHTDEMLETQRTVSKGHSRGKVRIVVVAMICAILVAGAEFYGAFLR